MTGFYVSCQIFEPVNECVKRESDSEALSPNLDRFHDSSVLQLLRHQTVIK